MAILCLSLAKTKFGLLDAADLDIFDETDTAVDEDIFLELLEAHPDLCLTVREKVSEEGRCYHKNLHCQCIAQVFAYDTDDIDLALCSAHGNEPGRVIFV